MEKKIEIKCLNDGQKYEIPMGCSLEEAFAQMNIQMTYPPIIARVNNKVEGMHFRVYKPKDIEFLDITSSSGQRAYTRTLFFILCKAVHDLYTPCKVAIDIPVSNGYYVDLNIGHPVTLEDAGRIRQRMQEIIDEDMPIHRHETTTEEAIHMFDILHTHSKVKLLKSIGSLYTTFYDIDEY
jgi:uridine kinase